MWRHVFGADVAPTVPEPVDLDADGVRLFTTSSDWSSAEVARVAAAAAELGGVTGRYRTILHVLRRTDAAPPG